MTHECKQIPANLVVSADKNRRYLQWLAAQIMPGFGVSLLPGYRNSQFEQAIERALDAKDGFAVHTAVSRHLIQKMPLLSVPTSVLTTRLHDWVEYKTRRIYAPDYFICSCSWDEVLSPLKRSAIFGEAMQLQKNGMQYKEMRIYAKYSDSIEKGLAPVRNGTRLESVEMLDAYFARYVQLFESVKVHGLLSQAEVRKRKAEEREPFAVVKWLRSRAERDIGVALGPDGNHVALPGGKHRAAIAIALGIRAVPAQVRMVHSDWLRSLNKPDNVSWHDAILEGVAHLARSLEVQGEKCLTAG